LEDWIYRNFDFTRHQVLLLWRNDPCVVIGRHQNPWVEANLPALQENDIALARRNSGGGTVYHDRGNLNCTFFTTRDKYNRNRNLEVICRALKREWDLNAQINSREDVTLNGFKISGTASKLGRNSYHHCTVLVNASMEALSNALHKNNPGIKSTATESVRASVKNISEVSPNVRVEDTLAAVGWEYMRTDSDGNDGGKEQLAKQRGFKMINPTNEWFPGLDKLQTDFESWEWTYGKTPKFTITRAFRVPQDLAGTNNGDLVITVEVDKGIMTNMEFHLPPDFTADATLDTTLTTLLSLKGQRFSNDIISEDLLSANHSTIASREKNQFITTCVKDVLSA